MSTSTKRPKKSRRATAFTATADSEVVVWTDEGDETPIVVPRYRVRALIAACLDALCGDTNTY